MCRMPVGNTSKDWGVQEFAIQAADSACTGRVWRLWQLLPLGNAGGSYSSADLLRLERYRHCVTCTPHMWIWLGMRHGAVPVSAKLRYGRGSIAYAILGVHMACTKDVRQPTEAWALLRAVLQLNLQAKRWRFQVPAWSLSSC